MSQHNRPDHRPADHPPIAPQRVGVLLINLGTPDAPDSASVRRYLKQFLSDKRVVEIPQIIWQPVLRGAVLTTRPKKSAHAYQQIWTDEGSPLLAITKRQAAALQERLGETALVDCAMRYGNPSIADRLAAMQDAGATRILLAPLYPQYCAATTATALDDAFAVLSDMRWQPAIRSLPPYYEDAAYIGALAALVESSLAKLDFTPDVILASFHGMPERTLHLGDPYHCHCLKTARLLSDALGKELRPTFQSRFGKAKWLEPYTDATLDALAKDGSRKVAIVAPGFSADCLETLEELAIRGREQFIAAGGTHFAYLPCLNDSAPGMDMLETIITRELAGWV